MTEQKFQRTSLLGSGEDLVAVGPPFGDVYPRTNPPRQKPYTARHYALDTLADFMSRLEFQRQDQRELDTVVPFRVPRDRIHIFQPDDEEIYRGKPAIGILPGNGTHETYGLGPSREIEGTDHLYCPNTILIREGDYLETIGLEIWGAYDAEREAVLAGLQRVFRLLQDSSALRLRCRSYYDRVASFALETSNVIDDDQSLNNRRRGHIFLAMQIPEVALVHFRTMVPLISHDVTGP